MTYNVLSHTLLPTTVSKSYRQIYLQPHDTLTFNLLTPKVDRFMPLSREAHVPFVSKLVFVFKTLS